MLAKAETQRQEEENIPKGWSGAVEETAQAAEEPKMQPDEEPPTPEDNRAPVLLGPLGPLQVMSQELLEALQRPPATWLLAKCSWGRAPLQIHRVPSDPLVLPSLPHHPSAKVRVRAKGRALGSAPIPQGWQGSCLATTCGHCSTGLLHWPEFRGSPQNHV